MLHQRTHGILDGEAGGIVLVCIEPVDHFSTHHPVLRIFLFYLSDGHGITQRAGLGCNGMRTGQRNLEGVDLSAHLGGNFFAVNQQRHFTLIGIDLDFGLLLCPIHIPAATKVNKGFAAPMCLVQIEGILPQFPVEGHKALLVFAVLAAFITAVGSKVKEVPHMGRPQIRPLLDALEQVLMVGTLIGFGVVTLFRSGILVLGICIRAVLGEANDPVGEFLVIVVEELVILLQFAQIPAEIQVIAGNIRNGNQFAFLLQHERMSHNGRPGRIHPVAQIVQDPVVLQ